MRSESSSAPQKLSPDSLVARGSIWGKTYVSGREGVDGVRGRHTSGVHPRKEPQETVTGLYIRATANVWVRARSRRRWSFWSPFPPGRSTPRGWAEPRAAAPLFRLGKVCRKSGSRHISSNPRQGSTGRTEPGGAWHDPAQAEINPPRRSSSTSRPRLFDRADPEECDRVWRSPRPRSVTCPRLSRKLEEIDPRALVARQPSWPWAPSYLRANRPADAAAAAGPGRPNGRRGSLARGFSARPWPIWPPTIQIQQSPSSRRSSGQAPPTSFPPRFRLAVGLLAGRAGRVKPWPS